MTKSRFLAFVAIGLWTLSIFLPGISAQESPQLQPRYGDPLPGLTQEELERFEKGRQAFGLSFGEPAPGYLRVPGAGPIANTGFRGSFSCNACHTNGGVASINPENVIRFGKISGESFDPLESQGGSLHQKLKVSYIPENCLEKIPAETHQAIRTPTGMFGYGLVEAIADETLLEREKNPPEGISGRAHMVKALENPAGPDRVGRFGWKAQLPTLVSMSADSALQEMGITSPLFPVDNHPNVAYGKIRPECDDGVADPEAIDIDGINYIERVADFIRFLAPPPQTPKNGMKGEKIFADIGCTDCHVPSFVTSDSADLPQALRGKPVKMYSDFLLHDMGAEADQIAQGNASMKEMRTAPLIGSRIRLSQGLSHDGGGLENRADFEDVIAKHNTTGSEAQTSAQNFLNLSQEDKNAVLAFLRSLGRAEFDFEICPGLEIGACDFNEFKNCYHGPQNYMPDDACAVADANQDGKVNSLDAQGLIHVYPSAIKDCQCNGRHDLLDILDGTEKDLDSNGVPDICREPLGLSVMVSRRAIDKIYITATAYPTVTTRLPKKVEFFYNFDAGEGTGDPLGSAFCINLKEHRSLGKAAVSDGSAEITKTITIPADVKKLYFQAGWRGSGKDSIKSGVVSLDIPSTLYFFYNSEHFYSYFTPPQKSEKP